MQIRTTLLRTRGAWAHFVLLVGLVYWTWPLLAGERPLSADHTVHFARSHAYCEQLLDGHVHGWSKMWAFGVPLGELYPPLGDAAHCAWTQVFRIVQPVDTAYSTAYAWTFAGVLAIQAWAAFALAQSLIAHHRAAKFAGVLAALWVTVDIGYYREGGWIYTVTYGVWPQALATALAWLGLVALARRLWPSESKSGQTFQPGPSKRAAFWIAAALLSHPIALLHLGICTLAMVLAALRSSAPRARCWCIVSTFALAFGLGAWWWLPMLEHRAYMANYGWLHASTRQLIHWLSEGAFAQWMSPAIGYAALVGIGISLGRGAPWPRIVAASAILLWIASSSDLYWDLRLDRLSDAFTHLQYQRFLISAKPAIFSLAALTVAQCLVTLYDDTRVFLVGPRSMTRASRVLVGFALCGVGLWIAVQKWPQQQKLHERWSLGEYQLQRSPRFEELDGQYQEFITWARELYEKEGAKRFHFRASRNEHWFMDFTALTGHYLYKSGFTPGDNFRFKPESDSSHLTDRLGIDYRVELRRSTRSDRRR